MRNDEPIVKNASDKSQVKNASDEVKRRQKREDEDLRRVLSTPEGANVIWRILERCNKFSSPVVAGDTHLTYLNLGKQDLGNWLFGEISRVNPIGVAKTMIDRYKLNKGA